MGSFCLYILLMTVILICDWNRNKAGDILELDDLSSKELVQRGIAYIQPVGLRFKTKEISLANKESEWQWNKLFEKS